MSNIIVNMPTGIPQIPKMYDQFLSFSSNDNARG